MKEKCKPIVFESKKVAITETRPHFILVFGPFKSRNDAKNHVQATERVACSEGLGSWIN